MLEYTGAPLKVMLSALLCWRLTSEADVGGMAVEVEPSTQYFVSFCCCGTDGSSGAGGLSNKMAFNMKVRMKQKRGTEFPHAEKKGTY